jgi:transcription termination factor Rho
VASIPSAPRRAWWIPVASPVDRSSLRSASPRESFPLQYDNRPPQNGRPEGGGRRRRSRRHRNRFPENGQPVAVDVFAQPEFPQPIGPPQLSAEQLAEMSKAELSELAKTFDLTPSAKAKKDDIIAEILEVQAQRSGLESASGVLDILAEGYGFLRRDGYVIGTDDIYISQSQIRRFELRKGDLIAGQVRRPKDNEKYYGIVKVESINGLDPEAIRSRRSFEELNPVAPTQRWTLTRRGDGATRAIDLFAPIGKGQRVLVGVPPRVDGASALIAIGRAMLANDPHAHLIVLSVDGRPEDAQMFARHIDRDIVATTFDEHVEHHVATAELVLERAKRLVEVGVDVVLLVDSLTRLGRAYAHGLTTQGRAAELAALFKPKRFFGAGRACEEGGSLTIVATVAIGTSGIADGVFADELAALATGELTLSREVAAAGVNPPIDPRYCATIEDDLLLGEAERRRAQELRSEFGARSPLETLATVAGDALAAR